jgi:thiamine pyrophosphokinase
MSVQQVVIVADGRSDPSVLRAAAAPGTLVIGADGGARRALLAGLHVDLVVGDLDSLDTADLAALVADGAEVIRARTDKDESDTELCLLTALERGATHIRLLGALGGTRIDHELANVSLLAHPRLDGVEVRIEDGPASIQRVGTADGPGSIVLIGAPGDLVTLLPVDGRVEGVTTHDLGYPLRAEPLTPGPARGLSNVMSAGTVRVETARGRLLVIHTRQTTREGNP